MKPNNIRHQVFIREMITHGNRIKAYQTAYPGCRSARAASNAASRLMTNPHIFHEIYTTKSALNAEVMAGIKDEIKEKFISMSDKRVWLARIMMGEKIFPQVKVRKGRVVVDYKVATPAQLLTAIDMDCRLEALMQAYDY